MPSASAIPAIPDNIEQINPVGPVLSDDERSVGSGLGGRSGLTTPNVLSPQSQDSRLTTPEQLHGTLPPPAGSSETSSTVRAGSDATATPLPIPVRLHERDATFHYSDAHRKWYTSDILCDYKSILKITSTTQ